MMRRLNLKNLKSLLNQGTPGNVFMTALVVVSFITLFILLVYPTWHGRKPFEVFPPDRSCAFCPLTPSAPGLYHAYVDAQHQDNEGVIRKRALAYCQTQGVPVCIVYIWPKPGLVPYGIDPSPEAYAAALAFYEADWAAGRQRLCRLKKGQFTEEDCR